MKRLNSSANDFVPPHVNPMHKAVGTAMECTMWLWIFWRAKHDWREFLVGSVGVVLLPLGTPAPLGGRALNSVMITFVLECLLVKEKCGREGDGN